LTPAEAALGAAENAHAARSRAARVLTTMVLRGVLGRFVVAAGLVWIVGALGGLGQALLTSAVVPDLDLLARMALGAAGTGAGLALPIGALAAVAAAMRQLSEEGAWLGLRTLGIGGRALAAPIAGFLVVVSVMWLGVAHVGEPLARASLRDARVAAAVRVMPVEGRTVRLGTWAAAVEGGVLHFAGGEWLGTARTWAVHPAIAGVVVTLGDGELRATDGTTRARFTTLEMPVPLVGTAGKVHPSERVTSDLMRQIGVSAALGRDAYERWILWKRTVLPLCLLPIGLGAVPLGLGAGGRRWPLLGIVGAQVATLWGVVRLADQWVATLGIGGAAAITGLAAAAWWAVAWRGWRDR
jgi:lipopolysaccharide export LptBFGC system permease protein LptF